MTQEQKNTFDMVVDVDNHLDHHPSAWSDSGPIAESVAALRETRRELELSALVQADGTSGTTRAKDLALELSAGKSYRIGRAILAWAKKRKNAEVTAAVDFSRTDLTKGAEQDLIDRHRLVHQYATHYKDQLAAYKITDDVLADLDTAINTFEALRGGRRQKENQRIFSTARIAELIGRIREQLDILDDEVEALIDNPEFVNTYFIARRITDRRATRGKAAQNGQLQGA